jgi:CHAT domain-containing protein
VAEPCFKEALEINLKTVGNNHPVYANSLGSLAGFYHEMGNYQASERLFLKALDILTNFPDSIQPGIATMKSNLAALYQTLGNDTAAEPLLKQALEIRKVALNSNNPDYATSLNNLAAYYYKQEKYSQAEPLYLESLQVTEKAFGTGHPNYATSLSNLAALYCAGEKYNAAEPLLKKAVDIRKKVLGLNHPDYATALNNMVVFYQTTGQADSAREFMLEANSILLNQLNQSYQFLSEKEAQLYFSSLIGKFESNNSFIAGWQKNNPSLTSLSMDNELALKGASLQSAIRLRQAVLEGGDSTLINVFKRWTGIKEQLNDLYNHPAPRNSSNMDSLVDAANTLEKDLIRGSLVFKNMLASQSIRWTDVQKALTENQAAIEIVNFRKNAGTRWSNDRLYAALIVRPGYQYPQFVTLFEEKELFRLLYYADAPADRKIRRTINPEILKQVYDLTWKPIEKYLSGVNTVYLAPSGLLTTVPFQALMKSNAGFLIDSMDIHYLLSTRELAVEKPVKGSAENNTAALFGGILYDLDSLAMVGAVSKSSTAITINQVPGNGTRGIGSFKYLPGTLVEVDTVNAYLTNYHWTPGKFTGSQATEGEFKRLSGGNAPAIIHIATHGFYKPQSGPQQKNMLQLNTDKKYSADDNPLRRTGLILAGGNWTWKNKTLPNGVEDGVLTALEVSNMDLRKTNLVVLSACETGLGDIKPGEGVFGLQRAFRLAGVKNIIMSLWNVDDKTTTKLMSTYFQYWLKGEKPAAAFKLAVINVRTLDPDPGKWAAFVMVE